MSTCVTWLSPEDCIAPHGLDLSIGSRDLKKVEWLYEMFVERGFDEDFPALVGYPLEGKVQLLSGTHRHEAAKRAKTKLPVTLWLKSYIDAYWGTDNWMKVNADIPVKELKDGPKDAWWNVNDEVPGIDEKVVFPY